MSKKSGIYKITNTINGKVYIGQSDWLSKRIGAHRLLLEKGIHHNKHLQRAYNKYGEDAFEYEIIEYCNKECLDEREMYYISLYDAFKSGYNQNEGGGGSRGYHCSDETRAKMRVSHRDVSGSNNPMYGRSWKDYCTEEEIAAHDRHVSEAILKVLPTAKEIVCLNSGAIYRGAKEAAIDLGVKESSVGNCCRGSLLRCGAGKDGVAIVCVYKDEYKQMTNEDIFQRLSEAQNVGKNNPNAKAVVNLTTGEVYETVKSAAEKYGVAQPSISSNLLGHNLSAGKIDDGTPCVWAYYSDYNNMTKDEIDKKLLRAQRANKKENKPNAKKVVCVNTGDVFTTVTEAGEVYHVDPSSIVACCKGKLKSSGKLDGEKLIWKYAS